MRYLAHVRHTILCTRQKVEDRPIVPHFELMTDKTKRCHIAAEPVAVMDAKISRFKSP